MTLPRTVADVLSQHVLFEIECIDRMYLNVFVPQLQRTGQVAGFLMRHRGFPIASTALVAPMSKQFVADIYHFAAAHDVPLVRFAKGQRKDDVMHQHLARFTGTDQIVFIGVAQEKAHVFRTERRHNPVTGASYPWIVTATAMVNHYYFYGVDDDFGPFFLTFCSYFPYTARLCINGNEYAKRQATKAGIAFEALDNGFAAVADPDAVQQICDGLTEDKIDALLRKWLARATAPLPAGRSSGRLPLRRVDAAGGVLADPDARQATVRAGLLRTAHPRQPRPRPSGSGQPDLRPPGPTQHPWPVPHPGDHPARHPEPVCRLQAHHDQAVPQGRTGATDRNHHQRHLRLRIGRRLTNLPALRQLGFSANRRLLDVQRLSHDPADGSTTLTALTDPVITDTGQRVAGMRFTDPRVQALLATLCVFRLLPRGFTNRDLRHHLEPLLGRQPGAITSGQATYDLRRLRHHGFIERVPHSHRYRVTATGHRHALFLNRVHNRLLRDGLADHTGPITNDSPKIRAASRTYETAIDDLLTRAGLAA